MSVRKIFLAGSAAGAAAIALAGHFWPPVYFLALLTGPLILLGLSDMIQTRHTIMRWGFAWDYVVGDKITFTGEGDFILHDKFAAIALAGQLRSPRPSSPGPFNQRPGRPITSEVGSRTLRGVMTSSA